MHDAGEDGLTVIVVGNHEIVDAERLSASGSEGGRRLRSIWAC